MTSGLAREILPGTEIAATALNNTPIRLYFQDTLGGVREFSHTSLGWTGGTTHDVRFQSKPQGPMAVMEYIENGQAEKRRIRIYSLGRQNRVHEQCFDGSGWFKGSLAQPAPAFTKIATIVWNLDLHVYYQDDEQNSLRIQEIFYVRQKWSLGATLSDFKHYKGTSIASIGIGTSIRVYVQSDDNYICEYSKRSRGTSVIGSIRLDATAKPLSPLAAITWDDGKRKVRVYSLDKDDRIQEYSYDGTGWVVGSFTAKKIQAAPYSKLSAIYWDKNIRVYYQSPYNVTIEEYCADLSGSTEQWNKGGSLSATPLSYSAIDTNGATYPVRLLPWIEDLTSWRNYDPSTVDGVGVLVGSIDGRIIGEDLKSKQSTVLKPSTSGNSYAWVYTPEGAIIYRYWEHDRRADYVRHSQLSSGKPVICAGEFRIASDGYLDTVLVMMTDASGNYKPKGSECLGSVATKLENLGIELDQTDWYWNA